MDSSTTTAVLLFRDFLAQASTLIKSQPFLTAASAGTLSLLIYIIHDIRSYIALGPHGLPDTIGGWYRQLRMTPRSRRDTCIPLPSDIDISAVSARYPPHGHESFLLLSSPPLEPRLGSRPSVCKFVAPQRQYTDRATGACKEDMFAYLRQLAGKNSAMLKMENSVLEGPIPALQLQDGVKGAPEMLYFKMRNPPVAELLHIHPPDGSTHVQLSLADSRLVIEKGWGQRHRLSGGVLPFGYTLVYAPRNRAEMEVWKAVVVAAVRFATEGVDGKLEFH